jgi:Nucleotidyl transferase AbiEii toxin, Type IV TA system
VATSDPTPGPHTADVGVAPSDGFASLLVAAFDRRIVVFDGADGRVDTDLVYEAVADVGTLDPPVEGVQVEPLIDLRANKLTCILSRSEPRDLVDLLFLDRAGVPPERDLSEALKKDGSIDPGVLAWLLSQFPVEPLPVMLEALSVEELRLFRDALAERLRRLAVPEP